MKTERGRKPKQFQKVLATSTILKARFGKPDAWVADDPLDSLVAVILSQNTSDANSWPAFKALKKKMDYAEYGGAPLLGVNGICIIGHGSSSPKAIKNAIRVAGESVRYQVNQHIIDGISAVKI